MQAEADALAQGMCTSRSIGYLRRLRAFLLALVVATGVVADRAAPAGAAPPKWVQRIDDVVGNDAVSVVIGYEGDGPLPPQGLGAASTRVQREAAAVDGAARPVSTGSDDPHPRAGDAGRGCRRHPARRSVDRRSRRSRDRPRDIAELAADLQDTGRRAGARPRDGRHRPVRPRLVRAWMEGLLPDVLHRAADGAHLSRQPRAPRQERSRTPSGAPPPSSRSSCGLGASRCAASPAWATARRTSSASPRSRAIRSSRSCIA